MMRLKRMVGRSRPVWVLTPILVVSFIDWQPAIPQTTYPATPVQIAQNPVVDTIRNVKNWLFPPPKPRSIQRGSPKVGRSGGTSGFCPAIGSQEPPLTALVPSSHQETVEIPITITGRPTFWFYVPYRTKRRAEFVVIDEEEKDVYITPSDFQLTDTPGIVGLTLPPEVSLQVGKQYRWVFSIICNASDRSGDVTVNGWIQRVASEPAFQRQLQSVSNPEQWAIAYANRGLWYETLTTLAELYRSGTHPTSGIVWKSLLQSVGLNDIASANLSSCCKLESSKPQR
ncbi:MAG: DUF928 domain-containing protein [Leptolyngbyaceae cyanobacterium HOT.MB2.61]|nr:DUF928 domain-containing protein [Leptolyngbyaceae cyanobacterium HOT.MB2.61]